MKTVITYQAKLGDILGIPWSKALNVDDNSAITHPNDDDIWYHSMRRAIHPTSNRCDDLTTVDAYSAAIRVTLGFSHRAGSITPYPARSAEACLHCH